MMPIAENTKPAPGDTAASTPNLRPFLERPNPLLVVISGPSGVGKDAVVRRMKELNYPFSFVVTATFWPSFTVLPRLILRR